MRIEHVAFNVDKPVEAAQWLAANLGMRVVRKVDSPLQTHFLADTVGGDAGAANATMLELYHNPKAPVPDYASMDPITLHVAFTVDDVAAARQKLLAAGAKPEGDIVTTPDGDELAMVRSPSGLVIQLMKRAKPLLDK